MLQVFAANTSEVLTYHQVALKRFSPQEGWIEQDALEILNAVRECIEVRKQRTIKCFHFYFFYRSRTLFLLCLGHLFYRLSSRLNHKVSSPRIQTDNIIFSPVYFCLYTGWNRKAIIRNWLRGRFAVVHYLLQYTFMIRWYSSHILFNPNWL